MRNLYIQLKLIKLHILKGLVLLLFLGASSSLFSQKEVKEIGVRGGYTAGFSFRVNLADDLSYEAQVGYRDQGTILSVIRQAHQEMRMDRLGNWEFLYGFGVQAGFYFTDSYRILYRQIHFGRDVFTPVLGMNGYLGIDYELVNTPVTFGVSFQPYMEISLKQLFGINLWDFGFCVRYRF